MLNPIQMNRVLFLVLLIAVFLPAAEPRAGEYGRTLKLAFYNVENLFDTVPNAAGTDAEFTPSGGRRWNSERYFHKLRQLARVLDTLRADLVGLAEVENEVALRDLLLALRHTDYNYVFRPSRDERGISVALLYRGSQFFPLATWQIGGPGLSRPVLAVRGRAGGDTLTVMVAHLPSRANTERRRESAARSLREGIDRALERNPGEKIVLMGDFNATPRSALARNSLRLESWPAEAPPPAPKGAGGEHPPLYTPFAALERHGLGSYVYRGRRYLYDYMALSPAFLGETGGGGWRFGGRCGVAAPGFLLQSEGPAAGYPRRSFDRGVHTAGYSDHLPVCLMLEWAP